MKKSNPKPQMDIDNRIGYRVKIIDKSKAFDWHIPAHLHDKFAVITAVSSGSDLFQIEFAGNEFMPFDEKELYHISMDACELLRPHREEKRRGVSSVTRN